MAPAGMPFRIEGFDGVREDGNEDREGFRLRVLPLAVVPLVDGL